MMTVTVDRVHIPAMSTVGYGYGTSVRGEVTFAGDHRPMRHLGEALLGDEQPVVLIEPWQVIGGEYVEDEES